ncbi:MAG: aldo/keto reductase [Candidatus Hydrogenedentes bacterium]|nr:aldo/keto reductase [Candidatus Hydrogenedentota bacterium]
MNRRALGSQGLNVSALGLGCMGMSWAYGHADDAESIRTLHRALDLGVDFWDTAEVYGPYTNEELLGRALKEIPRGRVTIATKFAWTFGPKGEMVALDSSPAHIKKSIDGSLKRLGTDYIDLYYQHRLDPKTPIEDTVGAMADLVKQGKVRYLGLSEVGPGTLRRAHAIHPITALQSEYSLWEREVEDKILPAARKLGVGFVAYSPMGRGLLTGRYKQINDFDETDWRRNSPRFQGANFTHNLELVETVQEIAAANNATAAQVALAWLLRQGNDIVPIPGTKRVKYLEENAQAASLTLPETAWARLDLALATFKAAGLRYPEAAMKTIDRTE